MFPAQHFSLETHVNTATNDQFLQTPAVGQQRGEAVPPNSNLHHSLSRFPHQQSNLSTNFTNHQIRQDKLYLSSEPNPQVFSDPSFQFSPHYFSALALPVIASKTEPSTLQLANKKSSDDGCIHDLSSYLAALIKSDPEAPTENLKLLLSPETGPSKVEKSGTAPQRKKRKARNEESEIQGRAKSVRTEADGGRHISRRNVPENGGISSDILSMGKTYQG